MSRFHNFFASGEGSSAQERSLIEAAHKIAGRDKLISEGRGLRLLPQLLQTSSLSQNREGGGAWGLSSDPGAMWRAVQHVSPGVLAGNGVSSVSPLVRVEQ